MHVYMKWKVATIRIIDDDLPGILAFETELQEVEEKNEDTVVHFVVQRKNGFSPNYFVHTSIQAYSEAEFVFKKKKKKKNWSWIYIGAHCPPWGLEFSSEVLKL